MIHAARKSGHWDADLVPFVNALMKYAGREFTQAKHGARGAIDDFKELIRKGYRVDFCRERLARCYLHLGRDAYADEEYAAAIEHWDEALRWTREPSMRRLLLTNKAGALEADNSYASAEEVVRRQIEEEPNLPRHWKNLGLVLGYQARAREALVAYARARTLCRSARGPFFLGVLHGNAWLRAALIHAKVLPDGDLRTAWRLLIEYRRMLGDDYNFCLASGDVALELERYRLADLFFQRAAQLNPHCTAPYQRLLEVAARWPDAAERGPKRKGAFEALREARRRYEGPGGESFLVLRICGGTSDYGDVHPPPSERTLLDPDPLHDPEPEEPPEWTLEAASTRAPFRPFDPALAAPSTPAPADSGSAAPEPAGDARPGWVVGAGAAALLALIVAVLWRYRRAGASA
ncbi:MAG: tetratricopeptide repeat protein [Planctomycetota bacterium]